MANVGDRNKFNSLPYAHDDMELASESRSEETEYQFDTHFEKDDYDSDSDEESDVVNMDGHKFDEYKDSDGEEQELSYPKFNHEVLYEPSFELGMLFTTREQFKLAVQSHAVRTKRTLKFSKIDPNRVYVKCANSPSPWKIHLTKIKDEETFQIREYYEVHKCTPTNYVKNLKSKWLGDKFTMKFVTDRKRPAPVFRLGAMHEIGCDISKDQAYRAKRHALHKLEGDPDMQYSKLWDYADEVRRTNPGSTVLLGCEADENGQQRFKTFYVCLDAVKKGFKAGCRPFIGVDGCHLKGPHKGILLSAVTADTNNQLFPLAWAIVDRECRETWEWFLTVLRQDLELYIDSDYTFMSDKQKGLIQAMMELFPSAEHRFCVRHLHGNMKSAGFRGEAFEAYLRKASEANTLGGWNKKMLDLKKYNEAAWEWLGAKPASQWSKSHFREYSKCDMTLNNVCESFNATLLRAREMPIITMLEWIREWLMIRFQRQRDIVAIKWNGRICPKIKKILEKNAEGVVDCIPIKGDNNHYEIKCHDGGQFLVDLALKTCSCRLWDLSGIPCKHACSAINHQRLDRDDYVDDFYTVNTFKSMYAATVKGINGQQLWGKSMYAPPCPPITGRCRGRPTSLRKKGADEAVKGKRKKSKLKRRQSTVKCSDCGAEGHNTLTCGRNMAPKQQPRKKLQVKKKVLNPTESSSSLLPPCYSEMLDEDQLYEDAEIPTQASLVQSNQVNQPGPSMYDQMQKVNLKDQGAKKFVSLAELANQSTKK